MPFTYFYVATPYTKFPGGLDAAHILACRLTGELIKLGLPCYSPIAYTHPIALYADMDKVDHDLWVRVDKPLLDGASAMIVIQAESWDESRGIRHEIETFAQAGKPIIYWDPATEFPYQRARAVMAVMNPSHVRAASGGWDVV